MTTSATVTDGPLMRAMPLPGSAIWLPSGAGDERDRSGARRDVDAGRRDESDDALDVDARAGTTGSDLVVNLLERSAQARADAATDRMHASTDRESGAGDRFHAARDRHAASTDREASSNDRRDAAKDHLTGVYERRSGFAELEREIARARRMGAPVVVAFFDVDGLKEVNDRFGHTAGDRMLVEFATMLTAHLRPYDLVMRYGGDEFVCVLPVCRRVMRRTGSLRFRPHSGAHLSTAPHRSALPSSMRVRPRTT